MGIERRRSGHESKGTRILHEHLHDTQELPLSDRAAQAFVAEQAYLNRSPEEVKSEPFPEIIDGNTIMRWWLNKRFAHAWGEYTAKNPEARVDISDREQVEHLVDELESVAKIYRQSKTLH